MNGIILPRVPDVEGVCPCCDPDPGFALPVVTVAGHTTAMAIRVGVQADSEEECAEGLAQLVDAGFIPVMLPKFLTDGRWMARAVPAPPPRPQEPARP